MNKNKLRLISSIVLIIMITVLFSACGGGNSIVGSWVSNTGENITFYKDGSCKWRSEDRVKYYRASESGALTFMDEYRYEIAESSYWIEGNNLYISGDVSMTLRRK